MTDDAPRQSWAQNGHTMGTDECQLVLTIADNQERLARPTGVEPVTFGFGNQHSIQLSYGRPPCILRTAYATVHSTAAFQSSANMPGL